MPVLFFGRKRVKLGNAALHVYQHIFYVLQAPLVSVVLFNEFVEHTQIHIVEYAETHIFQPRSVLVIVLEIILFEDFHGAFEVGIAVYIFVGIVCGAKMPERPDL